MSQQVVSLSHRTRRELATQMVPRYREASLARKMLLLDSLVEMTGYARKYAIGLLNQEPQGPPILRCPRQPRYGSEVQQALFVAWRAARSICAKRLIPSLPFLLPYLERKGRLQLNEEILSTYRKNGRACKKRRARERKEAEEEEWTMQCYTAVFVSVTRVSGLEAGL